MTDVRCPSCHSADYRTRSTTQERVCRKCGHIWKKVIQTMTVAKIGVKPRSDSP